jgi:mRNA interferase RelE/StbE
LAWLIEFEKEAEKELRKLDKQVARRIVKFLRQRVAVLDDPRSIGEALVGSTLGDYWKYRVGDYRVIADIQDAKVCVQVVRLGNRREFTDDRFRNSTGCIHPQVSKARLGANRGCEDAIVRGRVWTWIVPLSLVNGQERMQPGAGEGLCFLRSCGGPT